MDSVTFLKLAISTLVPVAVSAVLFILKRKTAFGKLDEKWKQLIIGLIFGAVAVCATEFGIPFESDGVTAIINVRDAAPICAGLLFGGPAGIIAGVIGGAERALAVLWGAGTYSVIACSVSTFCAGIIAALLHRFMFDGRRPTVLFAALTAVVAEVVHMTVLTLTHVSDIGQALIIVKVATVPMIVTNALSVLFSTLLISLISAEIHLKKKKDAPFILQTIEVRLLSAILAAYLLTTGFVFLLQTNEAVAEANELLELNTSDLISDVADKADENSDDFITLLVRRTQNRHIGEQGFFVILSDEMNLITTGELTIQDLKESKLNALLKEKYPGERFTIKVAGTEYYGMYRTIDSYYAVGLLPKDEAMSSRDTLIYINSFMEVLVFAALFVIIFFIIKSQVVNKIRDVNSRLSKIIDGDLEQKVTVGGSQEMVSLSNDINTTVDTLKHYIDATEKKIADELQYAKVIQHSALPSVFPAFPDVKEFDIFATMRTAKDVGGDFYDFYMTDDKHLAFLIADVSGKGIPAAMFMMNAKTLLRSLVESGLPLADVVTQANDRLCENNEAGMFVTAWIGILNIESGELEFVNAGHNPPVLYRNGSFSYLRTRPGLVLAGMEGVRYRTQSLTLKPGERILLYTDGVTEANDEQKKLFGEDRLLEQLGKTEQRSAKDTVDGILSAVDGFAGDADQFDDITVLMMDYVGNDMIKEARTFPAKTEEFDSALAFVTGVLEDNGAGMKPIMQISVAFEEMFVNVAHYAYPGRDGDVDVEVVIKDGVASITLSDNGIPFNPLGLETPDVTLSAEDRKIGGLGVFMVRKTMDEVSYKYENDRNIFNMKKKI